MFKRAYSIKRKKWLKEPDKSSLQNALKNLDAAYKNFLIDKKQVSLNSNLKRIGINHYKTNMTNNNIGF